MQTTSMSFDFLVNQIQQTHEKLQESAVKAINKHLTIRNWLTGFYIVEFEQKGEDRAQYGTRLLDELGKTLQTPGLSARNLKLYRQFYLTYPQIGKILTLFLNPTGLIVWKNFYWNWVMVFVLKPNKNALRLVTNTFSLTLCFITAF